MDEENAISGQQEMVKPGQALFEICGDGDRASSWALPQDVEHPVEEKVALRANLGYIEQFAQQGAEIMSVGCGLQGLRVYGVLDFCQLVRGQSDSHGHNIKL